MEYKIQMKKQKQFDLSEPEPKYQLSTAIQQFTSSQNQINIRTKITSSFKKMFDWDSDSYEKYSEYLNYPTYQESSYQNLITPQQIDIFLPPEQPIQQTYKLKDKQNFIYTTRQIPLISPNFGPISLLKRNQISSRQSWQNYKQLLQQMDKYQKEQQRKLIQLQSTQNKLGLIRIQKQIQAKKKQKKSQINFQQPIKPLQDNIQPIIILQSQQNRAKTNQNVVEETQNKQSQKIPCLEVDVSQINKFITESFQKNMIDKVLTDKKSKNKTKKKSKSKRENKSKQTIQQQQQEKIVKLEQNFSPDKQILQDIKQDKKRITKNQRKSKKNLKQQEKQQTQNLQKIIKIEHNQHKIVPKTIIKSINSHLNLIDLDHDYQNPFSSQGNLKQSNDDLRYPRRFHVKPLQYWKNQKTAYCKGKIIGIVKMKSIVEYLRVLKSNLSVISELINMKDTMIKGLIKFQPLQQIFFQGIDQKFQRLIISRKFKEKSKKIIFDNKTVKININEDINVLPYEQFSLINKSISVLVLVFTLIYKKVQ